jgi:hypothetical protein
VISDASDQIKKEKAIKPTPPNGMSRVANRDIHDSQENAYQYSSPGVRKNKDLSARKQRVKSLNPKSTAIA